MTTDLTLILTAHDETAVCGPTMRSAELAIAEAVRRGWTVEPIMALDNATDETARYFGQSRFDDWSRRSFQLGDPGKVRTALVPEAQGRFIAFLDADDLFSENWLAEGAAALHAAEERGERVIVHPELNVFFDGMASVLVNLDQASPLWSPYYLYVRNYYDTLAMAPRQAHLDFPYGNRDVKNGISREDFQFSIQTTAAGWEHRIVRDTIIFKRRRDFSLVTESDGRKTIVRSLPEMRIDRVRSLGRRPG